MTGPPTYSTEYPVTKLMVCCPPFPFAPSSPPPATISGEAKKTTELPQHNKAQNAVSTKCIKFVPTGALDYRTRTIPDLTCH